MNRNTDALMNISSLVLKTAPAHLKETLKALNGTGLCDICFHDDSGNIIVTIEGRDVSEEMRKLKEIQSVVNVISADLVYSYSENEIMNDMKSIGNPASPVPAHLSADE